MSQQLIARSPDLKALQDEGYNVCVVDGYLVVRDVPYLDSTRTVRRGTLISTLVLSNDRSGAPDSHIIHFDGEFPHHADGRPIAEIQHSEPKLRIRDGLTGRWLFSAKPKPADRYPDYYAKMVTYARILSGPVATIDHTVTAIVYPVITAAEDTSVFRYIDTASSRADIVAVSRKLVQPRVAIIGLGGTGSYVLDLVAKTPVEEIHLFDGDVFLQHNAFRAPGAASGRELEDRPLKVDYFFNIYDKMHRGIVKHPTHLNPGNLHELAAMSFVFLCMEGPDKKPVVQELERLNIPFIDSGMGVYLTEEKLGGLVRTTSSTQTYRTHVWDKQRISFSTAADLNEYNKNIQIADLNALNAALAVIKWKKMAGFYIDQEHEHHSVYMIGGNALVNEDFP